MRLPVEVVRMLQGGGTAHGEIQAQDIEYEINDLGDNRLLPVQLFPKEPDNTLAHKGSDFGRASSKGSDLGRTPSRMRMSRLRTAVNPQDEQTLLQNATETRASDATPQITKQEQRARYIVRFYGRTRVQLFLIVLLGCIGLATFVCDTTYTDSLHYQQSISYVLYCFFLLVSFAGFDVVFELVYLFSIKFFVEMGVITPHQNLTKYE
jgi:hypothetical protein